MAGTFQLDKLMLAEYAAEVVVYFEKHKILEIISRICAEIGLVRPDDPMFWIGSNIRRIANEIYKNCLECYYDKTAGLKFYTLPKRYLYRIVIYGRHGSGRKTQAVALVKQFNLVYIDVDLLIHQYLKSSDDLALALTKAFADESDVEKSKIVEKIVYRRLLQSDALHKGWVMVNYPNTFPGFQNLFERCKVPPNKLVYLQCPELLAARRLIEKPKLGCPQDTCDYMGFEMLHFRKHEACIDEYLKCRFETINIDASPCSEFVKTNVLSHLQRVPYMMGLKK